MNRKLLAIATPAVLAMGFVFVLHTDSVRAEEAHENTYDYNTRYHDTYELKDDVHDNRKQYKSDQSNSYTDTYRKDSNHNKSENDMDYKNKHDKYNAIKKQPPTSHTYEYKTHSSKKSEDTYKHADKEKEVVHKVKKTSYDHNKLPKNYDKQYAQEHYNQKKHVKTVAVHDEHKKPKTKQYPHDNHKKSYQHKYAMNNKVHKYHKKQVEKVVYVPVYVAKVKYVHVPKCSGQYHQSNSYMYSKCNCMIDCCYQPKASNV